MAEAAFADPPVDTVVVWEPQPGPQTAFVTCPVFEAFFGGARGGGKTDAVLGDWISHASQYGKDAIGLMVRRERTQLVETIERSRQIYTPLGAKYHEQDKMWRFPDGARLRFAYLERDSDADAYQGHSYTRVYIEEIGTFPSPAPVMKLMATLRSGSGVPVGFRATGNPGGPGHSWVKERYIDPAPTGWHRIPSTFTNPWTSEKITRERVYIPSRLQDNTYLGSEYVANLYMSGSAELVKAWLEGDWNAIEGAFFDCWDTRRHVIEPFAIPEHWLRFRSMDWGSASPFSVGWWAIVSEDYRATNSEGSGVTLPRGCMVRYREWYGAREPNVGLKLTAEEVGKGIAEIETAAGEAHSQTDQETKGGPYISYGVLDPAAFAEDGGPSIAERIYRGSGNKVRFRKADNRRVPQRGAMGGWDLMRNRLKGDGDGNPMMVCFSTCRDSIRTIPVLQHDADRPEDLDTDMEDHCFTGDTLVSTNKGVYSLSDLASARCLESGWVWSSDGDMHAYRSARLVKCGANIVKLTFDDGTIIRCTPDHRFLTTSGWVEAQSLSSLSLTPFRSSEANVSTDAASTSRSGVGGYIAQYGKRITDQFRMVAISITGMATGRTTRLKTWRASTALTTSAFMRSSGPTSRGRLSTAFVTRQPSGTAALRVSSGTRNITRSTALRLFMPSSTFGANNAAQTSRASTAASSARTSASRRIAEIAAWMTSGVNALFAAGRSSPTDTPRQGHARGVAGSSRPQGQERVCISVENDGRADVYCLTVPDTGNFVLANGAIVSNCADEVRYASASRPWTKPTPVDPEEMKGLEAVTLNRLFEDADKTRNRW